MVTPLGALQVEDSLPMEEQSKVVYWKPCSCGRAYIEETRRRFKTRLREHQDVCQRGTLKKLAVGEPVKWE